jgi:hypothetical protein
VILAYLSVCWELTSGSLQTQIGYRSVVAAGDQDRRDTPESPQKVGFIQSRDVGGGTMRLLLLSIAAVVAVFACTAASPATRVDLGIANGTTLTVSLFVNGQLVGVSPPDARGPTIDPNSLPPLPWTVEARSPTGRVLTSMIVEPGEVRTATGPGDQVSHSGTFGRVDLSCGRLTIWAGDVVPSGPIPPPSPGSPGDCVP